MLQWLRELPGGRQAEREGGWLVVVELSYPGRLSSIAEAYAVALAWSSPGPCTQLGAISALNTKESATTADVPSII